MNSILSSEDTRQTGVYRIVNTQNGRVYVGSAAVSFKERYIKKHGGLTPHQVLEQLEQLKKEQQ